MSKVFSITDKLNDKRRKEHVEFYRMRLQTVRRIVQCSSCQFKCAMCGYHLRESDSSPKATPPFPELNLCESCRAELDAFLEISSGKKESHILWHNEEWLKLWSVWLQYQQALRAFKGSTEFQQLGHEEET